MDDVELSVTDDAMKFMTVAHIRMQCRRKEHATEERMAEFQMSKMGCKLKTWSASQNAKDMARRTYEKSIRDTDNWMWNNDVAGNIIRLT